MDHNIDLSKTLTCIYCFNDINETIITTCDTCNTSYNCYICYEAWNNKCYLSQKHISCGLCRELLCSSGICKLCLDLLFDNEYNDLPDLISITSDDIYNEIIENEEIENEEIENEEIENEEIENEEILHYLNYNEELNNEEIINNTDNDTRLYLIWCRYQYNLLQQFLNVLEEERKNQDANLIEKYRM